MSNSKRSQKRSRAFNYESYEPRRMLAGDVIAMEWGGNLFIRGDAESNQIQLVANEDGQLKVVGVDGTTINNESEFLVTGSTGLNDGGATSTQIAGGLRVNLGMGDDSLEVIGTQFDGLSVIYGGAGDDSIELSSTSFNEHLTIQTFDGDDAVTVTQSEFHDDFYLFSLDGADTANLSDNLTMGHAILVTGNDADHVALDNNDLMGSTQLVLTGNGDDLVELASSDVGENGLGVYAGHGSDHVTADFEEGSIEGTVVVNGQQGNDIGSMTMDSDAVDDVFAIGFEADGELAFESSVGGAENVEGGAFSYAIEGSTAREHFATPVQVESTQNIKSVEWTGTYERDFAWNNSPDRGDSFVIEIYEDAGDGAPDSSTVARFEVGGGNRVDNGERNQVTRYSTGEVLYEYTIYEYSADVDYTLEAGKQYWVSIYSVLEEVEYAEGNLWNWGMALSYDAETLKTQGANYGSADTDWRIGGENERPDRHQWLELDLRLRS